MNKYIVHKYDVILFDHGILETKGNRQKDHTKCIHIFLIRNTNRVGLITSVCLTIQISSITKLETLNSYYKNWVPCPVTNPLMNDRIFIY